MICRSPFGNDNTRLMVLLYFILVVVAWGYTQLFTGRAAYLHLGAFTATIMEFADGVFREISGEFRLDADHRPLGFDRQGQNAFDRATAGLAHDEPSRVARFDIAFIIKGDFDETVRHAIAEAAEEEICTVSNTLRGGPDFVSTVSAE